MLNRLYAATLILTATPAIVPAAADRGSGSRMRGIIRKRCFAAVLQVLALVALLVPLNSGESKAGQWHGIAYQAFEGTFPPVPGKWITYDCSHTSTQGIWAKTSVRGFNSANSAHPRAGVTPYNYNTCTWTRFGPFSLAGATDARVVFKYWLDSEVGYDFFRWEYICNSGVGGVWTGQAFSGNVGAWASANLSLKPCVGKTPVYVQFTFSSDQSVNYQGVFLDNVRIEKWVP
jgi:hypothetical protein